MADDDEYFYPTPPYDFFTLEGVMLKLDPKRLPIDKDTVITSWMKGGASNKDTRNQALATFLRDGQLVELDGKYVLTGEEDNDFHSALQNMPPLWAGKIFLAKKAQESGVIRLKGTNTLIWNAAVASEGEKKPSQSKSPTLDSEIELAYSGKLVTGKVFAPNKISKFVVKELMAGMQEVLNLMIEGDVFGCAIDFPYAYKERGSPPDVPGFSTLVFEIRLIKVLTEGKMADDRATLLAQSSENGATVDDLYS